METALCIRSHEMPTPDGGFKRFTAGTSYPLEGLAEDQILAFFEHPEKAPSRRLNRRTPETPNE